MSLGFFAILFGFLLLRRERKHQHAMERLRLEQGLSNSANSSEGLSGDDAPALALRLPEPHRLYALALLCRLEDAPLGALDAHSRYLLTQARQQDLPATLRGYLSLTPQARQRLGGGQRPEALLQEQLELISRGVEQALGRDAGVANEMISQSHYLRDKFQPEWVEPIHLGEPIPREPDSQR